jgi:hypothetical protein
MTITKTEKKKLDSIKKALDKDIQLKYREGLGKTFDILGLKGVAKEIKAGRRVRDNVIYGLKMHHVGPRYDLDKKEVIPQSKRSRELEHQIYNKINEGLVLAGEKPFNKEALIKELRAKDRAAEKKFRNR